MSDYEQTEALPLSPGFLLQEARKKLNLTIEEVAIRLLLKESVVIGLENDEYSPTLSPTFIKGYIRSYAKLVNLEPEDVVAAYKDISGVDTQQKSRMQSFSRKISRDTYDSRWMYVTYGVIAVVIILIGLFAWQNTDNGLVDVSANTNTSNASALLTDSISNDATTLTTPLVESSPSAELAINDVVIATSSTIVNEQPVETNTGIDNIPEFIEAEQDQNISTVLAALENADPDLPNTEILVDTTEGDVALSDAGQLNDAQQNTLLNIDRENNDNVLENEAFSDSVELVFTFEQDCWIKITDATGEDIAYGVKKAGRVMPVSGQAPFSVILGAPKGVAITFAGNDVDISGFPTNATARFTLPLQETL